MCHKCGLRNHLSRDCKTPEEHYQNALDINIDLVDDSGDTDIEIQDESLQNNNIYIHVQTAALHAQQRTT